MAEHASEKATPTGRRAWPWPKLIAHRGGGSLAPENTLAAMRKGLELGFQAVEFDVMLSADHVPVLMHDAQFGRTVAGTGAVATTASDVLLGMDAGAWYSLVYRGEPVPSYAQIVRFCNAHGLWMNVEIKPAPGFERMTGEVVGALTRALFDEAKSGVKRPALPLFSSFSAEALAGARASAPHIPRGLLFDVVPADWREQLESLACVSLHCNHEKLTAEAAADVHAAAYGLLCYTVNTPQRASELFAWGVDAVCTDRLDLFGAAAQTLALNQT